MAPPPFANRAGAASEEAGWACSRQNRTDSPGATADLPGCPDRVRPQAAHRRNPDGRTPPALPHELRERARDIRAREAAAERLRVPHDRLSGGPRIDFPP